MSSGVDHTHTTYLQSSFVVFYFQDYLESVQIVLFFYLVIPLVTDPEDCAPASAGVR